MFCFRLVLVCDIDTGDNFYGIKNFDIKDLKAKTTRPIL